MRIRQEIIIKFLSAAMVVLLIFSGIFGGLGYRAYAAQTTYPENDTVTISDNETENKYPEITPESTSYLYCYNQLATWDSGETMQRYYKDLRDICWDFYNGELEASYELIWEDENDSSNKVYEWCIDKALHKTDYNLTEDEYAVTETALFGDMPIFYFLFVRSGYQSKDDGTPDYTSARQKITIPFGDDLKVYFVNRDYDGMNYKDKSRREECKKEIEAKLHYIYDLTQKYKTKYDKQQVVFQEISRASDYNSFNEEDEVNYYSHSVIGNVEEKDIVCEGYAKSVQMYLNYCNVETIAITGIAIGIGHVWNATVLDDGKWYYSDLTWSDDTYKESSNQSYSRWIGSNSSQVNIPKRYFDMTHNPFLTFQLPETAQDDVYMRPYDEYVTYDIQKQKPVQEIKEQLIDKITDCIIKGKTQVDILYDESRDYDVMSYILSSINDAISNINEKTGDTWCETYPWDYSSVSHYELLDDNGNKLLDTNGESVYKRRFILSLSKKEEQDGYLIKKYNFPYNCVELTSIGQIYNRQKTFIVPQKIENQDLMIFAPDNISEFNWDKVIFQSNMKVIYERSFRFSGISSVKLNDGLKQIKYGAFSDCRNLKSVYIPESVNVIENYAFGYVFGDKGFEKSDGFTIYGEAGSAAQKYAEDNGFAFIEGRMNEITYGDANGDGKIDSRDAVVIKKYVAGFTGFTIDLEASDVNADGKVDTRDAVKILKKIAGFDVTLGAA